MTRCWLCDRPIDDPPRIIGRILAGKKRLAHLECWRTLGEHDLELRAGGQAGPGPDSRRSPGRP